MVNILPQCGYAYEIIVSYVNSTDCCLSGKRFPFEVKTVFGHSKLKPTSSKVCYVDPPPTLYDVNAMMCMNFHSLYLSLTVLYFLFCRWSIVIDVHCSGQTVLDGL